MITARYQFYAAQRQFHKIRLAQSQNVPAMSGLASKKLCEDNIYHFIIFRALFGKNAHQIDYIE